MFITVGSCSASLILAGAAKQPWAPPHSQHSSAKYRKYTRGAWRSVSPHATTEAITPVFDIASRVLAIAFLAVNLISVICAITFLERCRTAYSPRPALAVLWVCNALTLAMLARYSYSMLHVLPL